MQAQRSSATLTNLFNELADCDLIHCLPSDCFGDSISSNQVQLQDAQGTERAAEAESYWAGIHSSYAIGTDVAHTTNSEKEYTRPPMSESSLESDLPSTVDMGDLTLTNAYEGHIGIGLSQGAGICGDVLQFAKEFIADSIFTLDDINGSAEDPPAFKVPPVGKPSNATSGNQATPAQTSFDFDRLFSVQLNEFGDV